MRIAPLLLALFAAPALADQVTTDRLPNGMEIVVVEDHRAPVVTHMVWYRGGAADERPGHSGVAHFLEHLMFKGTDTLAPGELSKVVAANGGSDNAFTSSDYTAYFQRIAADRLGLVMGMEADRMRGLKLSADDWKTELQVIIEERAQRTDSDPARLFGEQIDAAQFLNHPYGAPIIGWKHEMEALTRQDALDWYHSLYAPQNAILIVAGDVTPAEVKALAEKTYGPIPGGAVLERARRQEPPQLAARRLEMRDARVAEPVLTRSYLAPEANPGALTEAAALTVLAHVLGGSAQTSVLSRALTVESSTATYVGADYDPVSLDPTTFSLTLVPAPGVARPQAEAALDAQLSAFLAHGPEPEQLARIKRQLAAAEVYRRDDVGEIANFYGRALTSGLTVEDVQVWPEALAAVTGQDVLDAARKVLVAEHSVTAWLLPEGAAP